MKIEVICRIIINFLLLITLMAVMSYHFWGDAAHEWIGASMFVLFLAHHVLNLKWYKIMFKGKYTPYRVFQISMDLLVFLAMIGLMVSGLMLSQHVLAFSPITIGKSFARILHLLSSYWGFVLFSLHLGLHWKSFVGMFRINKKSTEPSTIQRIILNMIEISIAAYGFYVFIQRDLLSYMLLQTHFVYFDYSESKILFYFDYLAMLSFFVWVAKNIATLLRKISSTKNITTDEVYS